MTAKFDPFGARDVFSTAEGDLGIYRIRKLQDAGLGDIDKLPFSIRVLLESVLRNCDGYIVSEDDVKSLAGWDASSPEPSEIPFMPARVVLQDFTGVPCVVDLAAMRSAMQRLGGDPAKINPLIPVDLVIDHSVQVDKFGTDHALEENVALEFHRNKERYEFLRWGQKSLKNFSAIPPNVGIVHQVNLEYLAKGVFVREDEKGKVALPDSLVGTDSHTTMINGLGVVGWGVGGIEAEAVMLGQPIYMLTPQVVGFELTGKLPPGVTATDMVLTITQILRKEGVVGKFVEFFGPGVSHMSLADRATIANMAPEYGATMGFFPVDSETLNYMRRTGRTAGEVDRVERYTKEQGLFRTDEMAPTYTKLVSLDLSTVEPSLAGPKRPQDRVPLKSMKSEFQKSLVTSPNDRGFGLEEAELSRTATVEDNGQSTDIGHGAVVIAAITSCTNTSNPSVMLAAGLLAKKAAAKGLTVKPYVKTSLAPGSRVVTDYLVKAELMDDLEKLGFNLVGYGCTTCIGNSGPLPEPVANAVTKGSLVASAVLSGNRNFEGRVNPYVKANYLASPPLVVAYALAGTVDIDLETDPLGTSSDGESVYLKDIWPTNAEILETIEKAITPEMFQERYNSAYESNPNWNAITVPDSELYTWDTESTYIQEPPFLDDVKETVDPIEPITGARVLALLGDSVTTDHISPAGAIAKDSPAGRYLMEHGVEPVDFNSYGSRRGNDRVMHRGTFANIRIRNRLTPEKEGGYTKCFVNGETMAIFDAAEIYKTEGTPLVVIAGKEYGTGSSRDWAAKGTFMLGVKAVIASSFERIHRSNLIGMGVLPLEFPGDESWESLGLTGEETYDIYVSDDLKPQQMVTISAKNAAGEVTTFDALVRIDTPVELDYYRNGGILQTVLLKLLKEAK
ncbi:aconitate hydratase AcnA [Blastopirellula marina]|uniref:Aconitate hydratase n=1 Tax=Blastopirellula marina TaxID=124 RepID=A0A2S8F6T6_9BACT|nr:aconitate hydratase AcnA [Blastopirellula marina]PQO27865.1 aconitate hydratase AcnA [Blastopirellula marina]PTL41600.1 aconitate hydratase AcnA [Blastopirellula marina]